MAPIIDGLRSILNGWGLMCAMLSAALAWIWLDILATWKDRQ